MLTHTSWIGKHEVKHEKIAPIWEEDFAFHILKNMAQNKKTGIFYAIHKDDLLRGMKVLLLVQRLSLTWDKTKLYLDER